MHSGGLWSEEGLPIYVPRILILITLPAFQARFE
jgi:hypothetical protein